MNWSCIRCHFEVPFRPDEIDIDSFGIYFLCPFCKRRNQLESLGQKRGLLLLRQTGK